MHIPLLINVSIALIKLDIYQKHQIKNIHIPLLINVSIALIKLDIY